MAFANPTDFEAMDEPKTARSAPDWADPSEFELMGSTASTTEPAASSGEEEKILPTGIPELPYPDNLERGVQQSVTRNDIAQAPEVKPPSAPLLDQAKAWFSTETNPILNRLASTGMNLASGFEAQRAKAATDTARQVALGMTGPLSRPAPKTEDEREQRVKELRETTEATKKPAMESAKEFSEAGREIEEKAPKGALTSIGKGIGSGLAMFAEAEAGGVPLMATAGATEAYGNAKAAGKTDEQADHAAARTLLALAVFGGANKAVSSGIAKYLGKDTPALQSFLVQSLGQSAGNELTSRLISSYEAAMDAPEGQRTKAAADAASKFNLESTTQNIAFGVAGGAGSLKGKPEDYHIDKAPDEILHETATHPEFTERNPDFADAAKKELAARAETTRSGLRDALTRLPGDTQDKVNGILDKQASGQPLSQDERATLIQVQSYASKLAQGQSDTEFTSPTSKPVPSTLPTATPATSIVEVPSGNARSEAVTELPLPQPKAYTSRIAQAAQITEPLKAAATEAKADAPAAAAATEELAKAVGQKVISSPQPQVETPSTTGEQEALIAERKAPAEEVLPATEAAAVKPVEEGTRIVGPVLQVDGKTYAEGTVGQHHKDIVQEALDNYFKENPDAAEVPRFDHRFKDDKDNVLDREPAYKLAKSANQLSPETTESAEALARSSGDEPQLHADHLIEGEENETQTRMVSDTGKPPAVVPPVETPSGVVERVPSEVSPATEAPKKSLLDQLEALLNEEEAPVAAQPEKSATQKRVDAIRADIEANKDADTAWKNRRRKDLKAAEAELTKEQEAQVVEPQETTASEPTQQKESWQKTKKQIEDEGGSLTKHRLDVRAAVGRGDNVPLEVLEDFNGHHWADKMRREKYGEDVSDSLLTKIIDSLKDDKGNLYFDPLFIKSVGKPALCGALKLIREAVESGGLAKDVMTDVVSYIKKNSPDADENKTREFFQPVIDEALGKQEEVKPETPKTEEKSTPTELPPSPKVEVPMDSRMLGEGGRRLTSTKNEIVDQERERRGEPPILSEAKKALGETWDEAMKRFEKDPKAGENLVAELLDKPRAITATDEAVLLRQKVDVMNELSKATETALDENADPGDRGEARARASYLMDELSSIDEATRKAGTEWGRTGRFRQMLAAEDYSLSRMLQRSEMAKERPLTGEEKAQVKKMSDRISDLEKQLAEHELKRADELEKAKNGAVDEAIKKMGASEPVLKVARRIVDKWKSEAEEARKSMGRLFGPEGGGVGGVGGGRGGGRKLGQKDVEQSRIEAIAKIARAHIAEVGLDLAEVTSRLVKEFGEKVNPYIDRAWAIANGLIDKERGAAKAVREITSKTTDPKEQRANLIQRITARKDAPESVGGLIQKLAENFVRNGITEREPLLDAVHAEVKKALPDITRRDVRDAISGYGQYKELSKDEVKIKLRDLKGQMQQISKLEDMLEKGQLPKKTGVQRREQSAEERQLLKEVNKIKKELGLESTDPDQLKGALDAAKVRTRNRIEDLQRAIEKKEKIPKSEKKLQEDDELRDLKTQRDALQTEYDATFGKAKPTSEEIAADKAQKAVDRASAALDRQQRINSGEIKPEPKEKVQPLSELEKELRDRTEELRDAKRKADAAKNKPSVEEEAQKGVDAAAAAVDRWDRILKGELEREPNASREPLSNLEEELRSQADAMRKAADELRRQPKSEDAKLRAKEDAQIKSLEKAIADYERRIKEADFSSKGQTQARPERERVTKVREARDAAKKAYDELKKAQKPQRTPEEIALAAYKARTQKRIDDLNDRAKRGDFSKKERKPVELDKEGLRLKEEAARAKLEFDRAAYRDRQKNLTKTERILDFIPKLARANLLSNPITLAKLAAAAALRLGATPLEEIVGGALGKLPFISEIAARAPREGGFNSKAEAKALTAAWTQGLKDAASKFKKGETALDVTAGKRNVIPHHWLDFFGNIHGAMKAPVVRAEYARSFEKRAEFYANHGIDVTDPGVLMRIHNEAYRDAQRAIFQQDNRVVQIWNTAMRQLEMPSKTTGRVSTANKAIQSAAKTILPIVKIPTNIVAEAFQYATGAVTGSARLANAFRRGVETLKPEEADLIMRELKKGSLGGAVMLLGFLASQSVGGFYQPGQKRDESDVKPGTIRVFGKDIPQYLLHNPLMEQLQVGSTMARVAGSKLHKRDEDTQGLSAGALASAIGLVEEVPFLTAAAQLHKLFTPNERMDYLGELARSRAEPQFVQWTAQQMDREKFLPPSEVRSRKPETFSEEMEMGIPGLRENVPLRQQKWSPRAPSSGRHTSFAPPWKHGR